MTRAVESSWRRSTPWQAKVGFEWCRLCQLSPIESNASGAKFVERSCRRVANGLVPQMWQAEFTAKVACCRRKTLTRPPQTSLSDLRPPPFPKSPPTR